MLISAGGVEVTLSDDDAQAVYDSLWADANTRGAVSAAARVRHSMICAGQKQVVFEGRDADALKAALRRLGKI